MFHNWRRYLITLALVLSTLGASLLNAPAVLAAGRISLSISEGKLNDTVVLSGTGFVSQTPVTAYFSNIATTPGNEIDSAVTAYEIIGQSQTDGSASFSFPFGVPPKLTYGRTQATVASGDYYIYVTFSGSKTIQAVANFFVQGPVIATPLSGRIADQVAISGTGLKATEMVYVYFSSNRALPGASIGSQVTVYKKSELVVSSKEGAIVISFQIPSRLTDGKVQEDVHGGDYYFYTTYNVTTTIQTVTHFTVLDGELKVVPEAGNIGAEVKINGTGLRPNQDITVTYDDKLALIKSGDSGTNASGTFSSTIVIPESSTGSHQIRVTDVTGNHPDTWFTVNPAITMPASATLGQTVEITGSGFGEAVDITVSVGGQPISTNPPIITTNRKGSFNGSFGLPPPAGTVTVTVTDELGNKSEKSLNALAVSAATATISLQPATSQGSPATVGQKLTVAGSKFTAGSVVTVTYGKDQTKLASPKADAGGAFEAEFTVPAGTAGPYTVTAFDGANQATAVFVLENSPPPPPQPLDPGAATGVKAATRFAWNGVTDPSGVTYQLQASLDSTFAGTLLDKTGLTQPSYTLTETEKQQLSNKSGYYWRVRAVDGAANASIWSTPVLFFVGPAGSPMPQWIIYIMIGLGVVVLITVGIWLRQYMANRRT